MMLMRTFFKYAGKFLCSICRERASGFPHMTKKPERHRPGRGPTKTGSPDNTRTGGIYSHCN